MTFEIQRDIVEEKLDEWMQVCTSCEEQVHAPLCLIVWRSTIGVAMGEVIV